MKFPSPLFLKFTFGPKRAFVPFPSLSVPLAMLQLTSYLHWFLHSFCLLFAVKGGLPVELAPRAVTS